MKNNGTPPNGDLVITCTLLSSEQKLSQLFSYLKNLFNTATRLIRQSYFNPLVTGLTEIHCTLYNMDYLNNWLFYRLLT